MIAEAAPNEEEILLGVVDLQRLEDVRRNWPFLRDRRIDGYQGIAQRFLSDTASDKKD
jgi:N-carbamoylputrescine amidase